MKAPLLASALALVGLMGCSDDGSDPAASGPKGGILEVDNQDILLGEGKAGGPGTGGTSGFGGIGGTGGKPIAGASDVGKACEENTECRGELQCRRDTTNYISHLQCSTTCDSTEECEAIDPNSFCIGARTCVRACTGSADCSPKTRCNDSGWCERKGPGSGVSYCTGLPTPCSLQTGSSCSLTLGCTDASECRGVASSCYSQFDSFSCNGQDGCFWSSSSQSCSGSARSCSSMLSSLSCNDQDGCYYSERCTGTPLSCESLTTTVCATQPGCSLEEG